MATEEWIKRAIGGGKQYEELPSRVRSLLSASEYKSRYRCAKQFSPRVVVLAGADRGACGGQGEGTLYSPRVQLDRELGKHQLSGAGIL